MSVESFYVNVKIENFSTEDLNIIVEENPVFKSALSYYWDNENGNLSTSAALVSFLPNCELLFKLFNIISIKSTIREIETRRATTAFDFKDFISFFSWLYGCWQQRLEHFNKEWGAFIVKSSDYYKARQKLRKKYMLKY